MKAKRLAPPPPRAFALLAGVAWVAFHFQLLGAFFPNRYGALGSDYGYFLPYLLDGEYWRIANGVASVPWFTPAFCGGIPRFPNPQALYFSAPQWLTFASDPLTGVRLTLLLFAALGYAGFYLFQRRVFGVARPLAMLGAALFLMNGHFGSRMLIGHLTFHAFMLVPWLPLWWLARGGDSLQKRVLESLGVAGVLAYLASHAIAHVLFQALLFTAIAALLQGALAPRRVAVRRALQRSAIAVPLSLALCAAKLAAMAAFLAQFPRTMYPLAGVASLPELLHLVFRALFLSPSEALVRRAVVNTPLLLERPEFEFGVSAVPLVLAAVALARRRAEGSLFATREPWTRRRTACLAGALLLLLLPLALNYHHPRWHAWLSSIPIFASSSTLFRWLSVYVPVAILLGSVAAQSSASLRRFGGWVFAIGSAALLWQQLLLDRTWYHRQSFDPAPILAAFEAAQRPGFTPRIHANALPRSSDLLAPTRNSAIARGESQLACYETLFGFRLENLPRGALREGAMLEAQDGALNVNDPSCFVFPAANGCTPGAPFPEARRDEAEAFVSYRPFPFAMSRTQRAANLVNGLALVGSAFFVLQAAGRAIVRRLGARRS